MSTVRDAHNAGPRATPGFATWLFPFTAFVIGLAVVAMMREARLTSDAAALCAVFTIAGFVHDRFFARGAAGRTIGVILVVVAFAAGAVTGLLMPT
jgi:hypothetical protein